MTAYVAKTPNSQGIVDYTQVEDKTWQFLYQRQMELIKGRACDEYLRGLEIVGLNQNQVPQLPDVSRALRKETGWEVAPVKAVIPFGEFFELLANKKFPAATFIRSEEDIDYLQEPDIFHEIYGHCPLLTDPIFADFVHRYGQMGLAASKKERIYLARIFWFTVEFGLIQRENQGLRIYGAGILSSPGETLYSLDSDKAQRRTFDVMDALRTPYRIDIYQTVYYVISAFEDIYNAMDTNILNKIQQAIELGDFKATFPAKDIAKPKNSHDC